VVSFLSISCQNIIPNTAQKTTLFSSPKREFSCERLHTLFTPAICRAERTNACGIAARFRVCRANICPSNAADTGNAQKAVGLSFE
jgi:hypothetical protein